MKPDQSFPRQAKLKSQLDFLRLSQSPCRLTRGPLVFHAALGQAEVSRLGIRIGRRCGTAPVRNRVKRMLRETFRLMRHDLPMPIDLMISVRPHEPMMLAEYQRLMTGAAVKLVARLRSPEA